MYGENVTSINKIDLERATSVQTQAQQAAQTKQVQSAKPAEAQQVEESKVSEAKTSETKSTPVKTSDVQLRFIVNGETNDITVLVVDRENQKIIRAIPPEELNQFNQGDLLSLFA